MKVLVTGSNGQLGRAFRQVFPEGSFLTRDDVDLSDDKYKLRIILGEAVRKSKAELVLHCGAFTNVDQAQIYTTKANAVNHIATSILAQMCRQAGIRLIYFSTDYVFDGSMAKPYAEWDEPKPQSVYGWSKLMGEQEVQSISPDFAVIRLSYVFGDGNNLVQAFLRASKNPHVFGVSNQVMRPTYAVDVAESISSLIDIGKYPRGVLHLQNEGEATSISDFAREIYRQVGVTTPVEDITLEKYSETRPGGVFRPKNSVFNLTKARRLGINMPSWQDALSRYLTTFK